MRTSFLPLASGLSVVLVLLPGAAMSATPTQVDCDADPAALGPAIAAAAPGDRLVVSGTCRGSFVLDVDLTIRGGTPSAALLHPAPTSGPLIRITPDTTVVLADLAFLSCRDVGSGCRFDPTPVIDNAGTLRLVDASVSGAQGILNTGHMRLTRVTLSGNSQGGIENHGSMTLRHTAVTNNFDELAGGIDNSGTAIILHSTVSKNTAEFDVAGIKNTGTMTIRDSEVRSNSAGGTNGGTGGIVNSGTLTILDSVIAGNWGTRFGAIVNGHTLVIRDSRIVDNAIAWERPCSTVCIGGAGIHNTGTALVVGSLVKGNEVASPGGGGIENAAGGRMRLLDSRVVSNHAVGPGGGILNRVGAELRLRDVLIRQNASGTDGGGILNAGAITLIAVTFGDNTPNDCTGC